MRFIKPLFARILSLLFYICLDVVISDEQVHVVHGEEPGWDALAVAEPLAHGLQQFALVVFLQQDVLVGPGVPERDGFAPGSLLDEVGQFHRRTSSGSLDGRSPITFSSRGANAALRLTNWSTAHSRSSTRSSSGLAMDPPRLK